MLLSVLLVLVGICVLVVLVVLVVQRLKRQARKNELENREKIVKRALYHWAMRDWRQAQRVIASAGDLSELDLSDPELWRADEIMRRRRS